MESKQTFQTSNGYWQSRGRPADWTGEGDDGVVLLCASRGEQREEGSYDWFVAGSCRPATTALARQFNISSGKYLRKVHLHRIMYYLSYKASKLLAASRQWSQLVLVIISPQLFTNKYFYTFFKQMLDLMILKSSVPSHANIWDCNNKKEYLHWMDTILDISQNILFLKTENHFHYNSVSCTLSCEWNKQFMS